MVPVPGIILIYILFRSPLRRSPLPRSPLPQPESEWETDSDPPTDTEESKDVKDETKDVKPDIAASDTNTENKENQENKSEPITDSNKQVIYKIN